MAPYLSVIALALPLIMVALVYGNIRAMTEPEYICLLILLLVDAGASASALFVKRRYGPDEGGGSVPIHLALILTLIVLVCHAGVSFAWLGLVKSPNLSLDAIEAGIQGNLRIMGFSLAAGMTPFVLYLSILVRTFSQGAAEITHSFKTVKPPETDFSKARAIYLKGDTEGALRTCREYFKENPETPRALFEASRILMKEKRREEAADFLRQILHNFEKDDGVWTQATYDLAGIFENYMDDRETADYMLREIVKRTPKTEIGRLANGRLGRAWDKPKKTQPEQAPS